MRLLASVILVLGSVGLVGCGGSSATKAIGDDKQQLATLLTEFADTGTPTTMMPYFATGSPKVSPADHKKYAAMQYEFDGAPSVNGNTATGTVKMKSAADGKEKGSKTWEFVKEGEKWKLKSAPLP